MESADQKGNNKRVDSFEMKTTKTTVDSGALKT